MSNLRELALISQLRGDAEMRAAEFFRGIPTHLLTQFASDLERGVDLSGWIKHGTVDELLRGLSLGTLFREIHRRAEIAALEDGGE